MKTSVLSLFAAAAAVSATYEHDEPSTSVVYETKVYTVTSCGPYVTDCPGKVTSEIIAHTSTLYETKEVTITSCASDVTDCPAATHKPHPVTTAPEKPLTTSTIYETHEYTITACPSTVTDCPVGEKTSTVVTRITTCPVEDVHPTPGPSNPVETFPVYPTGPAPGPSKPVETLPIYPTGPAPVPSAPVGTVPVKPTEVVITKTIETCVPTVIYSVITVPSKPEETGPVKPAPVCPGGPECPSETINTKPYGTGAPVPTGGYSVPPKNNGTVAFTGAASTQKAGGLFLALGALAAALL